MTSLIACLSTGKGTWSYVIKLIMAHEWDNVFLVTSPFAAEKFQIGRKVEFIVLGEDKPIQSLVNDIKTSLKGKISGMEVALNLISGTGREHMAIISAILSLGFAVRLVGVGENGIFEI